MKANYLIALVLLTTACGGNDGDKGNGDPSSVDAGRLPPDSAPPPPPTCPLAQDATAGGTFTEAAAGMDATRLGIRISVITSDFPPATLHIGLGKDADGNIATGLLTVQTDTSTCDVCTQLAVLDRESGATLTLDATSGTVTLTEVDLTAGSARISGSLDAVMSTTVDGNACGATLTALAFDMPVTEVDDVVQAGLWPFRAGE